jgi:hypothetical protein
MGRERVSTISLDFVTAKPTRHSAARASDASAFGARTDRHRVLSKHLAIDSSHDGRLLYRMYDFRFQSIDTIDR